MKLSAYVKILRPQNAAMAAGAVYLGAWISDATLSLTERTILAAAALTATGFGNVINDIVDVETDRISHPERPLPRGDMSAAVATVYCLVLAMISLAGAWFVAPRFGVATLLPLAILTLYAFRLKGTPLTGNMIVSVLVAYALLFGSLGAGRFHHLIIPALLAMLLNFSREIVKDIQDAPGDRAAQITTSASLSGKLLRRIIYGCSAVYLAMLFLPALLGHFGVVYAAVVAIVALPLHTMRHLQLRRPDWTARTASISLLLKIEMLSGLLALAADRLFFLQTVSP